MEKIKEPASAPARARLPLGPSKGAYKTAVSRPTQSYGWTWRLVIAVVATAGASAIALGASRSLEREEIEISCAPKAPLPELPPQSRTVFNNNLMANLGWVPNLDGTAIAYPRQADCLVDGGRFRTVLALDATASALKISPASIADPRRPNELDPDAVLFRAQSGVLTEKSKQLARRFERSLLAGTVPDPIIYEWVITEFSFTLNCLKDPSNEERVVLSAIARAASEIMPAPDDTVRAVSFARGALETCQTTLTQVTELLP
jgi:hypothetical protein